MTYAAFYLPKENTLGKAVDAAKTQTIKGQLSGALKSAKSSLHNFDIGEMAKNINLQSATEFTQKYATAALTMIINQRPVTNQMMLDSLFNGLAPALNITAAQTGFNSIMELRNAVRAGRINFANFFQGLSNGLSTVTDAIIKKDYSKYGQEVPIDLTSTFQRRSIAEAADRKVSNEFPDYVSDIKENYFTLSGDFYGNNAELRGEKLLKIMQDKNIVTFREGYNIYEKCVLENFSYSKKSDDTIEFSADIKYYGDSETNIKTVNKNTTKNLQIANYTGAQVYAGRFA